MSSIDKDMQDIACRYDSRVRVHNTSVVKGSGGCHGQIKFYIGGECILVIQDRYGVINESEKTQIRQAIENYHRREGIEQERRQREAEERRRMEEEERKRREEERKRREEAERVAAYNMLISSVAAAKRGVDSAFDAVTTTDKELKQRISAVEQLLSTAQFDVSEVKSRLQGIDKKRQSSLSALSQERERKLAQILRFDSVQSHLSTVDYRQKQKELESIGTLLNSVSFNGDEVVQIENYVKELLVAQEKLYTQRKKFQKQQELGGVSGEIAKIAVQQIDGVNTNSLEQVEAMLVQLQETQEQIEKSNSDTEMFRIADALRNAPVLQQVEREFVPRQSTYTHIDYAKQCEEAVAQLKNLLEDLKNQQYTTATQGELEYIERTLQEFSIGIKGKNLLDSIMSMTDLVRCIQSDDRLSEDIFQDYAWLKNELAKVGIPAERLDVFHYDAQRSRLLDLLYARLAEFELEQENGDAETKRNMLALGLRTAFAEQGIFFVSGRISEKGAAEEDVFAIPGVDDVVIKAVMTEDSLHWYVCGTQKENGTAVSAERVLEIMRIFDRSGIPQKILNSLSQSLKIQSGEISSAVDCTSEDALQKIIENGIFDLSQTFQSADGTEISAGELLREISREFAQAAEDNRSLYAAGQQASSTQIQRESDRLSYADMLAVEKRATALRKREKRQKPKRQQANVMRARYMRR